MIILGMDPGTKITGWGVINLSKSKVKHVAHGVIKPKNKDRKSRIWEIFSEVEQLLLIFKPDVVMLERAYIGFNADTGMSLSELRGALIVAIKRFNQEIPIYDVAPKLVKSEIVGNGRATKEDVRFAVKKALHLRNDNMPDDAWDALAIALSYQGQIP